MIYVNKLKPQTTKSLVKQYPNTQIIENRYVSGAGVGATSAYIRRVLQRRAASNCSAICLLRA